MAIKRRNQDRLMNDSHEMTPVTCYLECKSTIQQQVLQDKSLLWLSDLLDKHAFTKKTTAKLSASHKQIPAFHTTFLRLVAQLACIVQVAFKVLLETSLTNAPHRKATEQLFDSVWVCDPPPSMLFGYNLIGHLIVRW